MAIGYTEIDFVNNSVPALNATNMNKIDEALKDACDELDALGAVATLDAKTSVADADELLTRDSAAGNVVKKVAWTTVFAAIWAKLGALIAGGTSKVTPLDADTLPLSSAADSGATRKLTWANLVATIKTELGYVAQTVGFKISGGTSSKTLIVSENADTANITTATGKANADGATATPTANAVPKYNAASGLNANGISFPATQVPSADANTLDDYAEGSATLAVKGSSTAGTYEITAQTTRYTKKGREVTLVFDISLAASITGGGSGTLIFDGLPYPLALGVPIGGNISTSYVTFTGKYLSPVYSSTIRFMLCNIVSGGASGFLDISAVAGSARFIGSITYIV